MRYITLGYNAKRRNMSEQKLLDLIRKNPNSLVAMAYRMGRKQANMELTNSLRKVS